MRRVPAGSRRGGQFAPDTSKARPLIVIPPAASWETRVRSYEALGVPTSDAQAMADADELEIRASVDRGFDDMSARMAAWDTTRLTGTPAADAPPPQTSGCQVISEDRWEQDFCPTGHGPYGESLAHDEVPLGADPRTVWTAVETDDGDIVYANGHHTVNRLFHVLTQNRWPEGANIRVQLSGTGPDSGFCDQCDEPLVDGRDGLCRSCIDKLCAPGGL